MLHLLQYILGIIFSCFGAILLLRAWLHYWALSPRHPLCEFVRRITDWLVVPISRVVPTRGGVHWSALLSALAVAVVAVLVHRTIGHLPATPIGLIIAPFAMMARWALEMISWGAIIWAVLSWVNRESPMTYTLAVLLDPFMRPIRRVLPTFRGIDFSRLFPKPLIKIELSSLRCEFVVLSACAGHFSAGSYSPPLRGFNG